MSRAIRLHCFHCAVPLTADDGDHYGYECHDCVVREHELRALARRDPEHPDLDWLEAVPVEVGAGALAGPGRGSLRLNRRAA